ASMTPRSSPHHDGSIQCLGGPCSMNTRWLRLSGAALVAGLTTFALAGPAHADPAAAPVTGNATSDITGWKVRGTDKKDHPVSKIGIDINGKHNPAYCIDLGH